MVETRFNVGMTWYESVVKSIYVLFVSGRQRTHIFLILVLLPYAVRMRQRRMRLGHQANSG